MNIGQWLFLIWLIAAPFATGGIYLACQFFVQKMPKQKQEALERAAKMTDHFITRSVQAIEQMNPELSGKTKKELATRMIVKLLNKHHISVDYEVVDAGIEAIVSLLPKTNPEG